MTATKKLSLIQLEWGLRLMPSVLSYDGTAAEMVAVYLATPGILMKARNDAAVLEGLLAQAAEMEGEEAAGVISDFLEQCVKYSANIVSSLPQVTEQMKEMVMKAQGQSLT